jgi:hypothetical protein
VAVIFFVHVTKENESTIREMMLNLRTACEVVYAYLFVSQFRGKVQQQADLADK